MIFDTLLFYPLNLYNGGLSMKFKKVLSGILAAAIAVSMTALPASAATIKPKKLSVDKIETGWNAENEGGKIEFNGDEASAAGWKFYEDPQDFSKYNEIAVKVEDNNVDLSVSVEYSDGTSNSSLPFTKSSGTVTCPLNEKKQKERLGDLGRQMGKSGFGKGRFRFCKGIPR